MASFGACRRLLDLPRSSRGDGASDAQAVRGCCFSSCRLFQRHAVQGEAQAALVEAADGDAVDHS